MAKIDDLLEKIRRNPKDVRYSDLCKICDHFFGELRQKKAAIEFTKLPGRVIHE
ncbi:MAG: hypothetical protein R6T98_14030 [Desulfatiglandales bacterium]